MAIQVRHFLICKPLDFFASFPENGAHVDMPLSTHYTNGRFRIALAFKSHLRVVAWAWINVFRASIIDESRSAMSVIAFHTAPPIGGLSCFYSFSHLLALLQPHTRWRLFDVQQVSGECCQINCIAFYFEYFRHFYSTLLVINKKRTRDSCDATWPKSPKT